MSLRSETAKPDVRSREQEAGVLPAALRTVTIRAGRGLRVPDVAELWAYRELFAALAARDIKVRYKHTALGAAWAVLQPFAAMVVFTLLSRVGHLSTEGVAPEVFYFCGMLPWLLFANALNSAGGSLLASQHLITKVYFPRLVVPVASVMTSLVDLGVGVVVLLAMMALYGVRPAPQIALLPVFVALAFFAAAGFGLWLSALTALFRDVRHVAPFATQVWLFATPVLYTAGAVHVPWQRTLVTLNPLAGAVEGFRWSVLGGPFPGTDLAASTAIVLGVLATGALYFARVERTLADRL